MLRWRLTSAAVILALLLSLVALDWQRAVFAVGGAWLFPALLAVSVFGSDEALRMFAAKGLRPAAWPIYLGSVLIPSTAALPMLVELGGWRLPPDSPLETFGWPLLALAACALIVLIAEMQRYEKPGVASIQAALAIFTLVYVPLLTSFLALLRLFAAPPGAASAVRDDWGLVALLSTLVIAKSADVGAYAVGRAIGRNKMTPLLSPGKTWEGAAGGMATACLASWAFFRFAGPVLVEGNYQAPPLWAALVYGLALGVAGVLGDLAESLLKRDMQQKDSSTWLPGLGGVLDIVDAVLFAAPVSYLFWVFGVVGPG